VTPAPLGGSPAGLLQLLRPVPVTVPDLLRAAEAVLPRLATGRLRLGVVADRVDGPVLTLEEDERRLRVPLRDLAEDLTDARVTPAPAPLATALSSWVAARPVPDAAAARYGVAVLDWTDPSETAVGWRVVVRRGASALPWTPSSGADPRQVARTRSAAVHRAGGLDGDLRVEGPVALWSHREVPLLASAVLAVPERLPALVAAAGLEVPDLHVVVTPHSPVACAAAGVAARLSGETGEACVQLPWWEFARLRWI
jgi:hypothetical protein